MSDATMPFMLALYNEASAFGHAQSVKTYGLSFEFSNMTVSIDEDGGRLIIVCENPEHPYVTKVSNITYRPDGDFLMDVAYTNFRTFYKVVMKRLTIPANSPWYIHGLPRNEEQRLLSDE